MASRVHASDGIDTPCACSACLGVGLGGQDVFSAPSVVVCFHQGGVQQDTDVESYNFHCSKAEVGK